MDMQLFLNAIDTLVTEMPIYAGLVTFGLICIAAAMGLKLAGKT